MSNTDTPKKTGWLGTRRRKLTALAAATALAVTGVIGVQAAMRVMQPQGFGSIINISSTSSLRAGMAAGAYSARASSTSTPTSPPRCRVR